MDGRVSQGRLLARGFGCWGGAGVAVRAGGGCLEGVNLVDNPKLIFHSAPMNKSNILPPDLERQLSIVGEYLTEGRSVGGLLPGVIVGLSGLPATAVSRAATSIAYAAKLMPSRPMPSKVAALFFRRLTDKEQLSRYPDLRYLFLFHLDGRIREGALQRIEGSLPSPFLFAAVAFRLNDWAAPVRAAANECAQRCFPRTSPTVIVESASALLLRQDSWGRWGHEREIVDATFARPDVASALADALIAAQTGPASKMLRLALRQDALDKYLERLATKAKQPSVRALAVQTIMNGNASWPTATMEWKWVDKSMGLRVWVPKCAARNIQYPLTPDAVLKIAISDRSALVRKTALDAVIRHRLESDEAVQLAEKLQADSSASVRERAAFILSRHGVH